MSDLPPDCYVVLHVGRGSSRRALTSSPPLIVRGRGERFDLTDDIWIERLDEQIAKNIQHACEPPNYNIGRVDHDKHLYAFVRRVRDVEKIQHEKLTELHAVVALSRLIHPTSTGDRYSAHVFFQGRTDSPIHAVQYRGMCDVSLVSTSGSRDWLSVDDGKSLRTLMPWLSKKMHPRVHRAYWNHEYAMRSYYLDARWPLVVSGLEALISIGEDKVTQQFCERVRRLAAECHVSLSESELRTAYKLRSKLVHAESFLSGLDAILPQAQHTALYEKIESVLRRTVLHCLLDETFGNFFRDDAAVDARWPFKYRSKPKKKRKP